MPRIVDATERHRFRNLSRLTFKTQRRDDEGIVF